MNVCMVSYSFYESDNRVMRYAEALTARGDTVDVIALRRKGQAERESLRGVNVLRIQNRERNENSKLTYFYRIALFMLRAALFLISEQRRQQYSLIHVHSVPDFLIFSAVVPKLMGAQVILDIHDLLPELYGSKFDVGAESLIFRVLKVVERICATIADHVIVPNDLWMQRLTARSTEKQKCSVIMNYPDPAVFATQEIGSVDGKCRLVYPGSLNWHQGLDIAIKAFAKAIKIVPNSEFNIYGEGPTKVELMELARNLGLNAKVIFHDPVSLREIGEIMQRADLG